MNNNIYIYGDIYDGSGIVEQIQELSGVDEINVYINSFGGDVKESLAIINTLKQSGAKINTYNMSFACSASATILLSGDNINVYDNSITMIHPCWVATSGNARELRRTADSLDKIQEATMQVYKAKSKIDEETLDQMVQDESWLTADEVEQYFNNVHIISNPNENEICASVKDKIVDAILQEKKRVQQSYIQNFIKQLK